LYLITAAVAMRNGPSISANQTGTIPAGAFVGVLCKSSGDVVDGPYGPDPWWDRVVYGNVSAFVTDEYVDTKADEHDLTKVPMC
jgi:uncharacterized protein YraI